MLNTDATDTEIAATTVNNSGGVNSTPPASTEKPLKASAKASADDTKSSAPEIHRELELTKAAQ